MSDLKSSPSDSRIERACAEFEDRKMRAYNLMAPGMEILWEAANDGNEEALKRLECIAEQMVQAAGDKNL
jgi:hypothetical protein